MTQQVFRRTGAILAFASALLSLGGCGGGNTARSTSPTTSGRAVTVRFAWPTTSTSRALSPSTQSVVVRVQDGAGFQDQQTINRSADTTFGTAEFFALSDGPATVRAQAFSGANGSGQTIGEAGQSVTLNRGKTDSVTLAFSAPYTVLALTPETGTAPVTLLQGATVRFVVRGTLDDGTLIDPAPAGTFASSSNGVATVTASGIVTGVAPGSASITFTDAQGRTASVGVTVRGGDAEVVVQ